MSHYTKNCKNSRFFKIWILAQLEGVRRGTFAQDRGLKFSGMLVLIVYYLLLKFQLDISTKSGKNINFFWKSQNLEFQNSKNPENESSSVNIGAISLELNEFVSSKKIWNPQIKIRGLPGGPILFFRNPLIMVPPLN